jgi:hypothetical protein
MAPGPFNSFIMAYTRADYDRWQTNTTERMNWRSDALELVYTCLDTYCTTNNRVNGLALEGAIDAYKRANTTWATSSRNRGRVMNWLFEGVAEEVSRHLPVTGILWSPSILNDLAISQGGQSMLSGLGLAAPWLVAESAEQYPGPDLMLRRMSTRAILYVYCHGMSATPLFNVSSHSWSATEMVDLLLQCGLRTAHQEITLLVCNAANSMNTLEAGTELMQQALALTQLDARIPATTRNGMPDPALASARQAVLVQVNAGITARLGTLQRPRSFGRNLDGDPGVQIEPLARLFTAALRQKGFRAGTRVRSFKAPVSRIPVGGEICLDVSRRNAPGFVLPLGPAPGQMPISRVPGLVVYDTV